MLRFALAAFLITTAAHAQSGNQRAEAEARSYLTTCPPGASVCVTQQERFVDSYVLAEAFQPYFIGDIVGFLDPETVLQPSPVRPDRVKACAWRYIRWKLATGPAIADIYRRDWTSHCIGASDPGEAKQKAEILALRHDMLTDPAVLTPRLQAISEHYSPLEGVAAALLGASLSRAK